MKSLETHMNWIEKKIRKSPEGFFFWSVVITTVCIKKRIRLEYKQKSDSTNHATHEFIT